jgi:DNA-binding SARP family transcriptional activator/tetratricopeptide (TPR) repeat protein
MLAVRVLGPMRVELDGEPLAAPASRRAWSLLAYLALHPGPHRRADLAARFWPDVLDASARQSLRSATWALRRALGPAAVQLVTSRDEIALEGEVWADCREFAQLVDAGRVDEALALGDGELLAGFDDEWAHQARAAHRDRLGEVLEARAAAAERGGDHDAAVRWARRQAALDPLDEGAHRRLMTRLAAAGDRGAALSTYEQLRERLRRDLSVAPAPATRQLAEDLRHEPLAPATASATSVVAARQLPLVGREREIAQLVAAWAGVRSGAGGAVTLSGEAGIGKTRLALELMARAADDGGRTAACAALDLGGIAPLSLWAELVHDLASQIDVLPYDAAWPSDLTPLAPSLERRLGADRPARAATAPDLERVRLYEGVVELVEWVARRGPLVLLMEDVHVADPASLELTGYVARRLGDLPVLLVLTRRTLPRSGSADALESALRARSTLLDEVELGPLPEDALARLVRHVAPLEDADVELAVAAAEGNALLAVERARALATGRRDAPPSLQAAVRAGLAPLSPEPRLLAELVAAAGRDLERAEIDALPVATPAEAATAALGTGLLVAHGSRLGFRHALLREASYADLPEPRRAWLHERLAAALAGTDTDPGTAAEVARHLQLAGRSERAAEHLVRAAAHARTLGALDDSVAFLREALTIRGEDGELLVELAEVEAWCLRRAESDETWARAQELLPPNGEGTARAWLRRAYWNRGALCRPHEVLDAARRTVRALDDAGSAAPEIRADALASGAWAEAIAGDPEEAERLLHEVHRVVGPDGASPHLAHAVAHARALALIRRGRFRDSYAPQIAAGELALRLGRADLSCGCWLNAACAAASAGEFDRALEFVDRGNRALRGQRLGWLEVQLLAARAHVLARLGRLAEARAAADEEAAVADRFDAPELRATAEHDRGMIALALGDDAPAAELLGDALRHDAPVSRPLARLARAEALARSGRCDEAEEELRKTVLEPVRPGDFPETLVARLTRVQGLVAAARGDAVLAARRLEEAAGGWRRMLDRSRDGERYTSSFADLARPPVLGLVEPQRELDRVLGELRDLARAPV